MNKKQILGTIGFFVLFVVLMYVYFYIGKVAISKMAGPTTGLQLKQQFEDVVKQDYNCIVLGNSRLYRGINPSLFNEKTYNFSHDNDSYNQLYWKIMFLEEEGVAFDKLILGTDYFMFGVFSNTRNNYYSKWLPEEYLDDYILDGYNTKDNNSDINNTVVWYDKLNEELNLYINTSFQKPFTYIVSAFKSMISKENNVPYLKSDGQYIIPNKRATEDDTVRRGAVRREIQMEYFEKILMYCKEKEIDVVVIMPPTKKQEIESYNEEMLKECHKYLVETVEKFGVEMLNYAYDENYSGIELYMDSTHLTPEGADLWSLKLNEDLIEIGFFANSTYRYS